MKRQVTRVIGVLDPLQVELWNARLDLLRSVGDIRGILEHLRSPVEPVADNGSCGNCACGGEALGGELSTPAVPK